MNKYHELRASLIDKADAIVAAAGDEMTDEQLGEVTELLAQAEAAGEKAAAVDAVKAQQDELSSAQPKVPTNTARPKVQSVKPAIENDPKRGFESFGEFLSCVHSSAVNPHAADQRLLIGSAPTGMQQGVGADGGFAVPPEYETRIWDGLNEAPDNLLALTDQYVLTGTESLTLNANAETSRVNGSRYGGIQTYWISEADQITNSNPTMRQIKIEPEELASLVYVTDKLLRNSTALESFVTNAAVDDINFMVSDAIFRGDGVGKPLGVLGHAATVSVAKEVAQAADTIEYANIRNIYARCHARARRNAAWYINQDTEPQLMGLKDDNGNAIYLPSNNLATRPFATLLGLPVIPHEYASTLGDEGDIMLGNFNYYATALRGSGIRQAASIHLRFDYAETAFRFMFEVDGRPWLDSALTPANGTNTLSPFVTLAERA